ncbi:Uncharacterised protein r2_g2509 [Pycnogonum litorale]
MLRYRYIRSKTLKSQSRPTAAEDYECDFSEYGMCKWKNGNGKRKWRPVPFGTGEDGEDMWGIQAPFKSHGLVSSPLIRSVTGRCFKFTYHKGNHPETYLKTWLKTPGRRDIVFEDHSKRNVELRHVNVNVARKDDFQVIFEGKSKNLPYGTHVMNVMVTNDRCEFMGLTEEISNS